jgi:hypothetical protein
VTASCPKCGAALGEGAEACPACGLAAAHFERFATEDDLAPVPPELAALWDLCAADWDRIDAHEKFLAAAARLDAFLHAGRLYRRAARERGAADPRVVAGLERVRRMAEAAWLTRPPEPAASESEEKGPYRTVALLLVSLVLLAGLGGITLYIVRTLRAGDATDNQVRPPPTRHIGGRSVIPRDPAGGDRAGGNGVGN